MKKDLLTILDLTKEDIITLLKRAKELKADLKAGVPHSDFTGKTMAMIFTKPSTRTRVSFQAGFYQMGGLSLDLNRDILQTSRGELIRDTAYVMSRYVDIIVIRTFDQTDIEDFARYATVPVINGLTDLFHPCQVLSDLLTIQENKGDLKNVTICYIGDGNNVAHSWLNAAGVMGLKLRLACPQGFGPREEIVQQAERLAEITQSEAEITLFKDPIDAVSGVDIIYTDVWVSMGQEKDTEERRSRFSDFQVNQELISTASPSVLVMHCLPAHRGEEITEDVLEGHHSIVFDQAENRLHVQKAIVEALINGNTFTKWVKG